MRRSRSKAALGWIEESFKGWRFPAFALSLIAVYELGVLVMLALPVGDDSLGRFAEEFKTWCFGYDPATGRSQPMYLVLMLTEPAVLGAVLAGVYWKQLEELMEKPRRLLPYAVISLCFGLISVVSLASLASANAPQGELPFPGERIRTSHHLPPFSLVDQEGRPFAPSELEGRVGVLTGIYASCGSTCPMLFAQAKRALAALSEEELDEVTMVALTLDPERDRPHVLSALATAQGISAPRFRLLTGAPTAVEATLDRLGIERRRDPGTGIIDHANLFLVVDRQGRIAYRFTLGERQERWLVTALQQLIAEGRVKG